jgi:hypothetical protein
VTKNPSLPSLIGSATSYIAFVPVLLSRICPSNQILNTMKDIETIKAKNAIKLAVVFEMNKLKSKNIVGMLASAIIFIVWFD